MEQTDVHRDLLMRAYRIAGTSPDPTTKVGALLIDADGKILTHGANRFPAGVNQDPERLEKPAKYWFLEHAERNAIFLAARKGITTYQQGLVAPYTACVDCARAIVTSGIVCVIRHLDAMDRVPQHWIANFAAGDDVLLEAGVEIVDFEGPVGGCEVLIDGIVWAP